MNFNEYKTNFPESNKSVEENLPHSLKIPSYTNTNNTISGSKQINENRPSLKLHSKKLNLPNDDHNSCAKYSNSAENNYAENVNNKTSSNLPNLVQNRPLLVLYLILRTIHGDEDHNTQDMTQFTPPYPTKNSRLPNGFQYNMRKQLISYSRHLPAIYSAPDICLYNLQCPLYQTRNKHTTHVKDTNTYTRDIQTEYSMQLFLFYQNMKMKTNENATDWPPVQENKLTEPYRKLPKNKEAHSAEVMMQEKLPKPEKIIHRNKSMSTTHKSSVTPNFSDGDREDMLKIENLWTKYNQRNPSLPSNHSKFTAAKVYAKNQTYEEVLAPTKHPTGCSESQLTYKSSERAGLEHFYLHQDLSTKLAPNSTQQAGPQRFDSPPANYQMSIILDIL